MRLILFFDLPTETKEDKKNYATFRKELTKNGYMMIQYSVYSKILNNRDAAIHHISYIKKIIPEKKKIKFTTLI